jgi:cell division protein FtsW
MSRNLDKNILLVILFLLGLGLVQVYSSSFIFATEVYGDGLYFFRRQAIYLFLGLMVLGVVVSIPWSWIERYGILLFIVATTGLVLTLIPGIGVKVGGATRWLQLPLGLRFEPGELFKVTLPLAVATLLKLRGEWLSRGRVTGLMLLAIPFALLLQQPDFGSFGIGLAVTALLLFCFGLPWKYVLASAAAILPMLFYLVVYEPYRYARVVAFLDPWADPEQKGFQIIQSLLSFHAGGAWGAGLGQGQGKLFFLPEAHTDFTLAVLGEEMGFVGLAFVLLLYGFLVYRGFQVALHTERQFPKVVALGVTLTLGLSVFINSGVVLGLLPTKGLTMPFLSYGGSSLLSTCFALGLLLNIERGVRDSTHREFRGIDISKP